MSDTSFRILLTGSACSDILKIVRFIGLTDRRGAKRWHELARQRLINLKTLPRRRVPIPESAQLGSEYQETRFPLTRILYRMDEDLVYVMRVVYEPWL
jgi:plasmid stabilization system protein ParE